jgi:hypothetical protein
MFTPLSDDYIIKFFSNSQSRAINKYKNLKHKMLVKWNANMYSKCLDKDLVPNYDKDKIRPTDRINVIILVSTSNLTGLFRNLCN